MKKSVIMLIVAVALSALALPAVAFAAWGAAPGAAATAAVSPAVSAGAVLGACPGFVDKDANGLCDVYERRGQAPAGTAVAPCVDGCPGYADADGDGVCDHFGTGVQGWQRGAGAGTSNPACPGYVDADGDGACDNRSAAAGCQRGTGHGRHGGGHGCRW